MQDAAHTEDDIVRHEVSEDGVIWRAFDPARDEGKRLHKRIEFAPVSENPRSAFASMS